MQSTNQPNKFLVPFAQNDSAKVEIPVTTTDTTRASQSLGFPPLTGMPPEAGGVPPQLEDFNGAVNQVARIAWWSQLGGTFGYDAAFAASSSIGGYPAGARVAAASGVGMWISTADNNVADPDTNGTGWAPGPHYGAYGLTGLTGGTQTLSPAVAARQVLTLAGTLTSNLVLIVPAWVYTWTVYNNTTGAFTVTVKTAAGSGAVVPQNGAPTALVGNGTNIALLAQNIAQATSGTQAARLDQMTGRVLRQTRYYISGGVQTMIVDGAAPTTVGAGTFTPLATTTRVYVTVVGGGGAGGGVPAQTASTSGAGGGGGAGGTASSILTSGFSGVTVTVGAGGVGVSAANGGAGGTTSFGALVSAPGGNGGGVSAAATAPSVTTGGASGPGTGNFESSQGATGAPGIVISVTGNILSGNGAPSIYGGGGNPRVNASGSGLPGNAPGAGGSGAAALASGAAAAGGAGGTGSVIVTEYA